MLVLHGTCVRSGQTGKKPTRFLQIALSVRSREIASRGGWLGPGGQGRSLEEVTFELRPEG